MSAAAKLLEEIESIEEATSYTPAVKEALQRVEEFCKEETGRPNHWKIGSKVYFFEWPAFGETEDGSVEGTVYEKLGSTSRRIGTYMLDREGKIIEFPFLPVEVIEEINR